MRKNPRMQLQVANIDQLRSRREVQFKAKLGRFARLQTVNDTPMPKRVLVTGSSGMIGSALCKVLSDRAYSIRTLSRSKESLSEVVFWNPLTGELDPSALREWMQ